MDEQTKINIAQRLASASGHLCGVQRMAHQDVYCIEVIRQIQAVQAALNKISLILLENHLENCILDVVEGENLAERQRSLAEVASIFEMSKKLNYTIEGELHDYGN